MVARIDTQRMILSAATSGDVDRLVDLDTDPEVMRYITGGRPSSREDAERRIRDGSVFVANDIATSEFVGWFSIRRSTPRERELGYRLRQSAWRRGLATEGARTLIAVAFDDPQVDRVWAQTMNVNTASRRVMERCGLRFVRTFFDEWPGGPIEGSELGDVEYELSRSEWLLLAVGDPRLH